MYKSLIYLGLFVALIGCGSDSDTDVEVPQPYAIKVQTFNLVNLDTGATSDITVTAEVEDQTSTIYDLSILGGSSSNLITFISDDDDDFDTTFNLIDDNSQTSLAMLEKELDITPNQLIFALGSNSDNYFELVVADLPKSTTSGNEISAWVVDTRVITTGTQAVLSVDGNVVDQTLMNKTL
ncbi:hypothetical protein [Thalassotalea agarivorans]|uniref:Uncharacterized protein n=1 Tax=Thalassotalea agarivorans TaxID=349064 RepID=A0A1I0F1T2_THASX|nr:hypothetical protein [Thalassotalea agarivorans]SET51583.1 hypothetical protein SAMN05660429_02022 [Thalassotalea agarivorans]